MVRSVLHRLDGVTMRLKAASIALMSGLRPVTATAALACGVMATLLRGLGFPSRLGAMAAIAAAGCVGAVALVWGANSMLSSVLSPDAAARALMAETRAARERENDALTHSLLLRQQQTLEVGRGESLALVLARANIPWTDINAATEAVSNVFDPRHMRAGQPVDVYYQPGDGDARLTGLAFRVDPSATISVNRTLDGAFRAREIQTPWRMEEAHVTGKVSGSLYQSAIDAGATEREVAEISNVFSYDIDFQRDVSPGDTFELLFDRYRDDEGHTIKTGDLTFISLTTRRGRKDYYFFRAPGETDGAWYDWQGHSARKFLMKTPIDGARLTSSFGMRMHPLLGYSRMHKGVDFGARTGTPVRAAGDGVVVRASWFGGYGNYVRIRHGDNYDTAYAHLSGYSSGLRPGAHVSQGQVIGYVGTTGSSTGPHLHYEVLRYNAQINPMNLNFATGRNLAGPLLQAFEAERGHIDAMRAGGAPLLASAAAGAAGLRGGLE